MKKIIRVTPLEGKKLLLFFPMVSPASLMSPPISVKISSSGLKMMPTSNRSACSLPVSAGLTDRTLVQTPLRPICRRYELMKDEGGRMKDERQG